MPKKRNLFSTLQISQKYKIPLLLAILLTLVISFLAVTFLFKIQPVIPLLYTLAQPSQQLVSKEWLLIFPATSFLINFFHLIIIGSMKSFKTVLLQIFAWSTILLQLLLLLAMTRIIIIVL